MTQLINLESYLECCHYAYLFGQDPQALIPHTKPLPLVYRNFCNEYLFHAFLPTPVMASTQPNTLRSRSEKLPQQYLWRPLEDDFSGQLFVVREANALELQSLQNRYIYANVYYYWSYAQQLQNLARSDRKLVIYNLDSFTPQQITPLTFEDHSQAPYRIPIVDTRSLKQYDGLKLSQSYESIYDQIIKQLAQKIASDLDLNKVSLSSYLKKINLLQNVEFNSTESISLIFEVDDRFYLYDLQHQDLENIIYTNLPIANIRNIINENQDYDFVLLSSYTNLKGIKQRLEQEFQNTLCIVDIQTNDFSQIWQEKLKQSFSLFGQHLDKISFEISDGIILEIPSKTYGLPILYEGQNARRFKAEYVSASGAIKSSFKIAQNEYNAIVPIKVNDEPISINGEEKVYEISRDNLQEVEEIQIEVYFTIKPGDCPVLDVFEVKEIDGQKVLGSKMKTSLIDPPKIGYIPIQSIVEDRNQKATDAINKLTSQNMIPVINNTLNEFILLIQKYNGVSTKNIRISNDIRRIYSSTLKNEILHFIPGQELYLFRQILVSTNFENHINNLLRRLINDYSRYRTTGIYDLYNSIIIFIGKMYRLHELSNGLFFYEILDINTIEITEYIKVLARISSQEELQKKYFSLFNQHHDKESYVWGYGRIMLWYLDFQAAKSWLNYRQHFISITNELFKPQVSDSYCQSALIVLYSLLSFREIDQTFCTLNSEEYRLAKQLCSVLRPIQANQIIRDKPLNQVFEELLDYNAGGKLIINLLKID